jgi:hypothetical protein
VISGLDLLLDRVSEVHGLPVRGGVVELTKVGELITNPNAWIAIAHIVGAAVNTFWVQIDN